MAYLGTRRSERVSTWPARAVCRRRAALPDGVSFGHGSRVAWVGRVGRVGVRGRAGRPGRGTACRRPCGGSGAQAQAAGGRVKPAASRRGPRGEVRAEAPLTRSTVTVPREPARAAAARASAAGAQAGRRPSGPAVRVGGPGQQGLAAALHVERSARRRPATTREPALRPGLWPAPGRAARARGGPRRRRSRGRRRPGRRLGEVRRVRERAAGGSGRTGRRRRRRVVVEGRRAVVCRGAEAESGAGVGRECGSWCRHGRRRGAEAWC